MKQKLYIRIWLLMLISVLAISSKAQTVNISGYSPSGTENGYSLFNVFSHEITVSSTSGSFDYVLIDNNQIAYNEDSYWSSYNIDLSSYIDGYSHRLQLKRGSSNYGICYFKVDGDEPILKDGIYFSINGENAIVVAALPDIEIAIIPETFVKDGTSYPVTQILNNAFNGITNLSEVTIPNSVTAIGNSAFSGCSGLTSVTIPQGVTSIGNSAFSDSGLISLEFNAQNCTTCGSSSFPAFPSTISTLTIGNNVTTIPDYFLYNGTQIESLTLPNSVTSIGNSAFSGCSGLISVTIPQGVTSIGNSAFKECSGLTSVTIPQGVTSIGNSAFKECSRLSSVTILQGVTSIGNSAFSGCSRLTSVTIPQGVTSIGNSAFKGCSRLTSVTIPQEVTSIGTSAFSNSGLISLEFNAQNCTSCGSSSSPAFPSTISTLTIGNNVTTIPDYFLYNGTQIESLTIPNSVISIGHSAFKGCSGLTSVTIPQGVTSIGPSAFSDSGLTSLEFNAQNCTTCGSSSSPAFPSTISTLTIGNNVTSIPAYFLYNGSQIENLTIPNSVTFIGYGAFLNANSKLKSLTIGSGVLSIGDYSFSTRNSNSNQYTITKVFWMGNTPPAGYNNIKASVNYVSNDQYSLNNQLQYQFLSSRFTVDGTIYVPVSPSERTCDVVDCLYTDEYPELIIADKVSNRGVEMTVLGVNQYAFYDNDYIQSASISNSGNIGKDAFKSCNGIETVILANEGNIESSAFYNCIGIQNATISNDGYLEESAFRGCTSLEIATVSNNGYIGSKAFYGCTSLQKAILSNNGYIGSEAFYGCNSLETVNLSNKGGIQREAFSDCIRLKEATILITGYIGDNAFYNCSELDKVELGNEINEIGDYAFYGCSSIPHLIIPNSVNTLGTNTFQNCRALESIELGNGINSLPLRTFAGCSSLNFLTLPNNISSIANYVFEGCSSLSDFTIEDSEQMEEEEMPSAQSFPNWTSTNHSNSSTSYEEYTFNVNRGDVLTFNYSVSSESGYDYLIVKLDDSEIVKESGSKSGNYRKVFETSKNVTLYMAYTKDGSDSAGSDIASVTDIWLNSPSNNIDYLVLGSNGSKPLFDDCPLDEVYIGRKLSYQTGSSYGYSPFYRNTSLRTVEITDAETQIYDNEFYGCTNLSSLKIGNGVKTIGNWAFSGCSSLDYFSAGYMVESIGTEAFSDCTGLTKYYSYSIVPPVCGDQALDDINKWECTLYVPDESSDEYQAAPQWKDFFFIEEMDVVLVAELRLNMEEVTLTPSNTIQLITQVLPANATDKNVIWSSSNPEIASVNSDGLVTAITEGTATIIVKSTDGNAETSCIVTVESEEDGVESIFNDSNCSKAVYNLNGYKLSDSIDNLAPGIYIVRQGTKTYKISVK